MKKYWMMIVALCLPILASCGGNQSRENVETSTTATTSAKEVQKDIATKSNSEASISSSKTAPSTTVERENDTGQDLYKEVLERYKRYVSLLNQGKREELQKEDKKLLKAINKNIELIEKFKRIKKCKK